MFITFEGIEGCGKSTQMKRLAERLEQMSIPVEVTLEPGGTRIGRDIRSILLDAGNSEISALAELFLYEADRAQHCEEVIKPALTMGKWVLCDRYYDATSVYQGIARGLDMEFVRDLNKEASLGLSPDLTFLVDCPVAVGLKRAQRRDMNNSDEGQDRFERERYAFHEKVREGYLAVAREESDRFFIVDGTLEEVELGEVIFQHIHPYVIQDMEKA